MATPATIQVAQNAAKKESTCTPGTTDRAKYARAAWPSRASTRAPAHPSGVAMATSTGRITSPATAMTRAVRSDRQPPVERDAGQEPAGQPETDAARQQGQDRPSDIGPIEPGKQGPAHGVSSLIGGIRHTRRARRGV